MITIYDTDDDGNIIVVFDTRWRFPETLGFSPDDPEYKQLQRMWGDINREGTQEVVEDGEEEKADER